jgi:uncharacterized protein YdhG (YjbR/CyaY superfamily)
MTVVRKASDMKSIPPKPQTVDEYFATVSGVALQRLEEIRAILKSAAPDAEEVISYSMPAIKTTRVLVYYAVAKEHIGFYPTASPIVVFKDELARYPTSKGAIQFPLDKPIPKTLVRKIVVYRLKEEMERAARRKTTKNTKDTKGS